MSRAASGRRLGGGKRPGRGQERVAPGAAPTTAGAGPREAAAAAGPRGGAGNRQGRDQMSFAPEAPTTRVPPTRVDTDTWVIHQVQNALGAPLSMYMNSMVIAGREPAIVDTGSVNNRDQWLEDVFGIV